MGDSTSQWNLQSVNGAGKFENETNRILSGWLKHFSGEVGELTESVGDLESQELALCLVPSQQAMARAAPCSVKLKLITLLSGPWKLRFFSIQRAQHLSCLPWPSWISQILQLSPCELKCVSTSDWCSPCACYYASSLAGKFRSDFHLWVEII